MDRQVHHLNRLVDDLLEVSRITRGIIEVKQEPQDLVAVVRAAIDTSRPVLEGFRHELIVNAPAGSICVAGDAVRLAQVFSNLLNNAAKYRTIEPLPRRRILIVDDSRDGGESMTVLLRVLGAEVQLVHSGRAALDAVELIALTGWGQDEDRQRSAAAGFNHHPVKPADIDQLRQLLAVA